MQRENIGGLRLHLCSLKCCTCFNCDGVVALSRVVVASAPAAHGPTRPLQQQRCISRRRHNAAPVLPPLQRPRNREPTLLLRTPPTSLAMRAQMHHAKGRTSWSISSSASPAGSYAADGEGSGLGCGGERSLALGERPDTAAAIASSASCASACSTRASVRKQREQAQATAAHLKRREALLAPAEATRAHPDTKRCQQADGAARAVVAAHDSAAGETSEGVPADGE